MVIKCKNSFSVHLQVIFPFISTSFFGQTANDLENTAYICTRKHTLAICLVNVVKDNDMLK